MVRRVLILNKKNGQKRKGRKRHYRSCRQAGRQGRKPEPLCELSVQGCEVLRQDKKKAFFEKFSDERFDKKRARNAHGKKILKIEINSFRLMC